jgi:endonuclease/exonuclease/phosphatase (EEP) superfamily protein YafD
MLPVCHARAPTTPSSRCHVVARAARRMTNLLMLALAVGAAGCVALTEQPRALVWRAGEIDIKRLQCDAARVAVEPPPAPVRALDPQAIRVVSWNIHKQDDEGWQRDLARFAAASDLLLLQEAKLDQELRDIIESAEHGWVMASSFIYRDHDMGVLSAARTSPLASCTERIGEPLIVIPKSSVVTWYPIAGVAEPLAVVNVHAINFTLTLGAYEAQFAALANALASHRGPIIFAGDLNTWTDARRDVIRATAAKLGLVETRLDDDKRTVFLGKQLDHILVRGLDVVEVTAIPVRSSDHNPLRATMRVPRR